ncbi:hypothetical protein H5P28_07855 [Ruficoccus amylovorans]|uniref:Uncharacterized protein n=1 Tax=Ruficoccus amylovorans TaxID=1804625 RepID=A0A842HF72_9BACT|nr:hypothetical protein [Ruficoccus amylovorans]MBC2594174.1 hypothetical protein [Ruficoccus amylovorans]
MKNSRLWSLPVFLLACLAAVSSARAVPDISIRTEQVVSLDEVDRRLRGGVQSLDEVQPTTLVYQGEALLLELRNNRFVRFRASPDNDLWIATKDSPMDLAWSYQDVKDFVVTRADSRVTEQGFTIAVEADKPSVSGKVKLLIEAAWNRDKRMFEYTLSSTMRADLEAWWKESWFARSGAYTSGRPGASLDAFDYHVNRISISDLLQNGYEPDDILYEAFVRSPDGKAWEKWPKLHVSFTTRRGENYIALNALGNYQIDEPGEYFGFLDAGEGGWLTQLVQMPETPGSSVSFMLCWFYQDVHFLMRNAVPVRGSAKDFELRYKVRFIPQSPAEASRLLDAAEELPWREQGEYQLPVFSNDNRFDELISGSVDTQWPWFANSWDCVRDDEVGYDDHYSVRIRSETPGLKAWYAANTWGYPRSLDKIGGKRFRMTARVRTAGLTGRARLAVAPGSQSDFWVHTSGKRDERVEWVGSEWLSGDNEWTELSVDFKVTGQAPALVLEQEGAGTTWFDNVVIKPLH